MRYMLIDGGIAINAIEVDDPTAFPQFHLIADPEGAHQIGDHCDAAGVWARPPAPDPLPGLIRQYDGLVQGHLDATAQAFGYGDPNRPEVSPILHAISYADEPAVPRYQAEGQTLRAWRSHVWAAAAAILNAVEAGTRTVPTPAEVLAELEAAAPTPKPTPP